MFVASHHVDGILMVFSRKNKDFPWPYWLVHRDPENMTCYNPFLTAWE